MISILIGAKNAQICENLHNILSELPDCAITAFTQGGRIKSADLMAYDVIILSTPLSDQFGLDLAAELKKMTDAALIVLAKGEIADEVQQKLKFTGAFIIGRPFNKSALLQAVKFAAVAKENIQRLEQKNRQLTRQLEDMKLVNRAKACLMEYLNLTEEQAHRYIQTQAMNSRKKQREIAEDILKTYGN